MANLSRVNGLTPVKHLNGSAWNGAVNLYAIPAADGTATFVGDLVKEYGTGDVNGINQVIQAAAGDTAVGVIVGFLPDPTNLSLVNRLVSTLRYCWVADSPDTVFEVQEDNSATFALTMIGENANVVVAAGNAVTGASGMQLNTTSHNTTALNLRILRVVQRPDNTVDVNTKLEVLINLHRYTTTTGF
jgi:hypothetical protein